MLLPSSSSISNSSKVGVKKPLLSDKSAYPIFSKISLYGMHFNLLFESFLLSGCGCGCGFGVGFGFGFGFGVGVGSGVGVGVVTAFPVIVPLPLLVATDSIVSQSNTSAYVTFTEEDGEAAFYGPKIDIQAKNVYGKEDTMITIQLDCAIAEKFDMYYVDQNGEKVRPYIIHRTSLGCYERTLAWLIEKYAGKFPTWLCPEQVRVLPISEKYTEYANKVAKELKANGVDVTVDARAEKIGYKIREARLNKLPYMLVVGAQEEIDGTVSVRSRFAGDEGVKPLADFVEQICKEIRTKEIRKVEVTEENAK